MRCPRCSSECESNAKFCPQCGWDLHKPFSRVVWSPRGVITIIGLTAVLWGASYTLQTSKAGIRPTKSFQEVQAKLPVAESSDPEIAALREAAAAQQNNADAQRRYAKLVLDKIRQSGEPPQALILEATDALAGLLKLEPNDAEALIALADLSFNQKVFNKAASLYERYLVEVPDDLSARARYASSLAFVGKPQDAIKELESVLSKDPKNFHALAYMSIAYAQVGDAARAQEVGKKALEFAPSPEARTRFQDFLTALKEEKGPNAEKAGVPAAPETAPERGGVPELARSIALNPVAGPKYVNFENSTAAELVILLRNFPMQNMPPFAKEKFYSGIREKAKSLGLKDLQKVIFRDADTGQTLDTLTLVP